MSTISRRAFLKTVGVGALSVAAMSVLAGCDVAQVPGTEEVVTGATEAKVGTTYLAGDYAVLVPKTEVAYTAFWGAAFKDAYETVSADDSGVDESEWKQTAINTVDAVVKYDMAQINFQITNTTKENLIISSNATELPSSTDSYEDLASTLKNLKNNTSYFSATCDGKSVPCAAVVANGSPSTIAAVTPTNAGTMVSDENVSILVALPVNAKEVVVSLTLGGKTLNYTIENKNANGKTTYVDLSKY